METLVWHVGDVVRKLRERAGWGQKELADKASVSLSTISRLENGRNYDPQTFGRIVAALGVREADIFSAIPTRDGGPQDDTAAPFRRGTWDGVNTRSGVERRSGTDRRKTG